MTMHDSATESGTDSEGELNSLVLDQSVVNAIMADALGLSHDQMQGVYEVGESNIKILFTGDSDE